MTASGYSWGGEQSHLTSTTTKCCGCFQQTKPSTAQSSAGTGQSSGQSLDDWQHHTRALSSYPICQIECSQTTVRGNAVMSAAERFTLEELRIQSIAKSHGLYLMEQQVFQKSPMATTCHASRTSETELSRCIATDSACDAQSPRKLRSTYFYVVLYCNTIGEDFAVRHLPLTKPEKERITQALRSASRSLVIAVSNTTISVSQ